MSVSRFDPKSGKWMPAVPEQPTGLLRLIVWWRKVRRAFRVQP